MYFAKRLQYYRFCISYETNKHTVQSESKLSREDNANELMNSRIVCLSSNPPTIYWLDVVTTATGLY
jgi:hypothetical protein